ncbi:MAG: NADH-quinone oxidoreductase subunit M [Candidatus Melainabacteria bacterium]|nr:NADH-quinone oxidoreductase subunit M [Candidatus Melainabacteria bacterium]
MEFLTSHSLSTILILLSLGAGAVALFDMEEQRARLISLSTSILVLCVTLKQYFHLFDPSNTSPQLAESYDWIGPMKFSLAVDGLSFSMVLLTAILLPCVIIASQPIAERRQPRLFYSLIMLLALAVMAVFMAKDLFLFFLAWELELVPMYFLIAIWGSKNRNYASMKFLLYTFAAGIALLIGVFWLLSVTGFTSFDMVELSKLTTQLGEGTQMGIFLLFAVCFIIKLPSVPFHTWLPDAHVEAPTPVSMLLAGILLKMGCYGLIRFSLNFFPDVVQQLAPAIAILAAVNIIYGAYAALIQTDLKKVIAYSSISHMGFILLGLASLNTAGYSGAVFQMFSHGLISAALFMIVGMIYERTHTREISDFGGLAKVMPQTFYLFVLAAMANLALPGLSGFVGESLVFYGVFSNEMAHGYDPIKIAAAVSALGVILTAAYMLWINQRVFYGEIKDKWLELTDARRSEITVLGVLLGLSILYGIYPSYINNIYEPQLDSLAQLSIPSLIS